MYSFSYLEPVCCSMSSSNCCFLTCIQISQEAGKVIWYSHLLKNFPVCCDPHKGWEGKVYFVLAFSFPRKPNLVLSPPFSRWLSAAEGTRPRSSLESGSQVAEVRRANFFCKKSQWTFQASQAASLLHYSIFSLKSHVFNILSVPPLQHFCFQFLLVTEIFCDTLQTYIWSPFRE